MAVALVVPSRANHCGHQRWCLSHADLLRLRMAEGLRKKAEYVAWPKHRG